MKKLAELRQPDDRTLGYTPWGLGPNMRPEDAAEFQQRVVYEFDMAPAVADGTRRRLEDLRTVFAHGVLCFELYTMVFDQALFVFEKALRDRFMEVHQGTVTFVDHEGRDRQVVVSRYEQVLGFLKDRSSQWRLRLPDGTDVQFTRGMLHDLREWARKAGLLRGQRNRVIEQALSDLRNVVAHSSGYHLVDPVEAVRVLRDLTEIINQLWGAPTPGGRLYPAPLRREVIVMAWPAGGEEIVTAVAADAFTEFVDPEDRSWECVILRAVYRPAAPFSDPFLHHYDSRVEVTHYPAELLWGPGTITDAAAWCTENTSEPNECDYLDRIFLIRHHDEDLYLPVRPSIAAALPDEERTGTWYTVKADHPGDAYEHVRKRLTGAGCPHRGPCRNCHAETLSEGDHTVALAAAGLSTSAPCRLPEDVRAPRAVPRTQQIETQTRRQAVHCSS